MADLYPDADLGEMINDGVVKSFIANGAITKGQLVKLDTNVSGDIGKVSVATAATLDAIGVALQTVADGETVSVAVKGGGGVVKVTNSTNAITVGTKVICGATGKIDVYPAVPAAGDENKVIGVAYQTFASGDTGLIGLD